MEAQGVVTASPPLVVVPRGICRNVAQSESAATRYGRQIPEHVTKFLGDGIGIAEIGGSIALLFLGFTQKAAGFAK